MPILKQWYVESCSKRGNHYLVSLSDDGIFSCNCPDWIYRHAKNEYYQCKHIKNVVHQNALQLVYEVVKEKEMPLEEAKRRITPSSYSVEELAHEIMKMSAQNL